MAEKVPEACCSEPGCNSWNCAGCEYLGECRDDPQKIDYCPRPHSCPNCGARCLSCELWSAPVFPPDFSKMTEGEALRFIGVHVAVKDGQKGLQKGDLFIPASDEKPDIIVASERKQDRVKGAKKIRCADCRCKVWLSPSTQEILKRYPETPVICIACLGKRVEKEKENEKEAS